MEISGPSAGSQHRRLEKETVPSQLLHRAASWLGDCHEAGIKEQASSAEADAACPDC